MVLTYQVPPLGSVWLEEKRNRLSLVTVKDGVERPMQRTRVVKKRVTVLGASPRLVTRARIEYLEHGALELRVGPEGERQVWTASPIHGRTYVVDATEGEVRVSGAGGAAPPAEEVAAVRAEERRFADPDTLSTVLARLPLRTGEAVPVPAAVARRMFGETDEDATLTVTLVSSDGREARLALTGHTRSRRGGVDTRADLAGDLRVDAATAQVLEMRVTGPIHSTGAMTADGVGEIVATRTPEPGWGG